MPGLNSRALKPITVCRPSPFWDDSQPKRTAPLARSLSAKTGCTVTGADGPCGVQTDLAITSPPGPPLPQAQVSLPTQAEALPPAARRYSYHDQVAITLRRNIVWAEKTPPPSSRCEVEVDLTPDGLIRSKRVQSSKGHPDWCKAVWRALERTQRIPPDAAGKVPPRLFLVFNSDVPPGAAP